MLSDRPYLRDDYQREKTSALTWLLSAIIAGFLVQVLFRMPWLRGHGRIDEFLELAIPTFKNGWIWTLITHSFLHSTGFFFHVIVNCFVLFVLGRELLPLLGARRFLGLYAAATIVGGLAWAAVHWRFGTGEHIGASAGISALIVVFACFFPNQQINFLLFFLFPVSLTPKHIAGFLVGLELLGLFVYEIPGARLPFDLAISSSAHLGGMLTGLLYYRFVHDARWLAGSPDRAEIELPRWMKRTRKVTPLPPPPAVEPIAPAASSREDIRAEVDRILDKINSHGFGALTPEEKRVLDDAKDLLSRR
jgi:membrane associated rhomboid family serine protease